MKMARTAAVAAVFLIMAGLFGFSTLQSQETVTIGTADMERVFSEYQGTKDFEAEMEKIQQDFQTAQQEGNQQRLMEIQQEFQIKQGQLIQNFHEAIEKASAPVSEKTGVQIIVAEVLYRTEAASVIDVSEELIAEMN